MGLLQRYILLELLRVFVFLVSVLTILLVFVGVFREASESGLGPFQVLQILPYVVPSLLPFTIPATLLLTVTVVYGRVAGDQEVIAAKAAGINVLSLLWPAFGLGAVLSVCSFLLTDQVIPWAVANIQRTVTLAMEDIFLDMLRSNHQVVDTGRGFSITVMGVEDKKLIMPTFQYTPPGHQAVTMQAQEATLEFDLDQQHVILHLVRGHIDIPGQRRVWFEREEKPFPLPHEIRKPKPRHQSMSDLRRETESLEDESQVLRDRRDIETAMALLLGDFDRFQQDDFIDYHSSLGTQQRELAKLNTEFHSRIALSGSCLFFVLLGGPFAIWQGRRQFLTSFAWCFGPILVGYYPLALGMINFSKSGMLNPAWATWVANVSVLIVASYYLRKVMRH